jgi:hypothetical protein
VVVLVVVVVVVVADVLLLMLLHIWISVRHLWFTEGPLPPQKLVAALCEQYDSELKDRVCDQASCVYEYE